MANRLPLHERHVAAGAKFESLADWELPVAYGNPAEEYALVRRGVGLLDRGDFGLLELTGRDRAAFLHALVSNEVKALGPGQGCAATLLDVHGKVQVVLFVWVVDDRILVVTPPAMAQKTAEALDHYLFSEKVAIRDVSGETALFVLAGPEAPETSERLMGARPPESQWSQAAGKLGDTPVRLVSGGRETGEAEVWIAGPASEAPRTWDALVGAGARPVGLAAFDALRIEAGTPLFGHGAEVVADDASVGRVTSATWSFGLERPIALAFVHRQHAEPGTRVSVRLGGRAVAASVSALPFTR